jgi:hypothetical protein
MEIISFRFQTSDPAMRASDFFWTVPDVRRRLGTVCLQLSDWLMCAISRKEAFLIFQVSLHKIQAHGVTFRFLGKLKFNCLEFQLADLA